MRDPLSLLEAVLTRETDRAVALAAGDVATADWLRAEAVRVLDEALCEARDEGAEDAATAEDRDPAEPSPDYCDDEVGYNPYAGGYDPDC